MFNDNEYRYIYMGRGNKKTSHGGAICVGYIRNGNTIKMGFTFCQPRVKTKDGITGDNFSRKEAHKRLIKRITNDPITTRLQDKNGDDHYRIEFDHSDVVNLAKMTMLKWYEAGENLHEDIDTPSWANHWILQDFLDKHNKGTDK
mgnify:CR=1 FL=1